jgi:HemY protein
MIRLVLYFLAILAAAVGLHWLADRPGTIVIQWQDYVAETSVFRAFVILLVVLGVAIAIAAGLHWLWSSPASIAGLLQRRRARRGLDALSSGMIAVGAGDRALALRYAGQARKALPNAPLTHLLRAQVAQLTGDLVTARRIFEAMLASPDTEQLGLRGLFLEAQREGATEASRQFAERALALNTKLGWPVEALFDLQCRAGDWQGALDTLAIGRRHNLLDKAVANRRRAVLLTAQAQPAEDTEPERALATAQEAHRLAPDLVPAAAIAGRILASQGNTPRAARVLLKTWRLSPHPDLAATYAYARPGDSPRDRLNRMRHLCRLTPNAIEGPIALAVTAIEAREWDEARGALEPLLAGRVTQRVCTLMARIEGEQHGHAGLVREWLARAVNAPRDAAWTADGVVSDRWAAVSPVTGSFDAFRWRVPVEPVDGPAGALLAAKMEELVGIGADKEAALADDGASAQTHAAAAEKGEGGLGRATMLVAEATGRDEPARGSVPTTVTSEPLAEPARVKDAARVAAPPVVSDGAPRPAGLERRGGHAHTLEPKIFVPPRAPDDPGPDGGEELEIGVLRPSGAKA